MKLLLNADHPACETPEALDIRQNVIQLFAANDNFHQKETNTKFGREPSAQGNEPLIEGGVAA